MQRRLKPLKLQNSPLVLVLTQVRIAPIEKMGDFVPDIQERLRRAGLPRFSAGEELQVAIGDTAQVRRSPRWEFQNKDQTRSVILTKEFIAIETSDYDVYESFEEFFEPALQTLADVAEPGLAQRVGLRYVDMVRPAEGETYRDYLKPELHGLRASDIEAKATLFRSEMLAKTKAGTLRVRCVQSNEGLPFPADLRTTTLNPDRTIARGLQPPEEVTFLDLDHFSSVPLDYDATTLVKAIGALHENLDLAFRASVTDHAMKVWKKEERSA